MQRITSRQNPLVGRFRHAVRHPGEGVPMLLEGAHLVETALDCGVALELVAVSAASATNDAPAGDRHLLRRLERTGAELVAVSEAVLRAISPVRSPSGLVALAARPDPDPVRLLHPPPPLVLVAVGIQDPGNLGALVRAADAAGATGVIATNGSADAYGWKALRGSMGSALRLPVWSRVPVEDALSFLAGHRVALICATPGASRSIYDADLTGPTAVLVGAEGSGLPPAVEAAADAAVAIPMRAGVESLNVAVASALVAYEAQRQRHGRAWGTAARPPFHA